MSRFLFASVPVAAHTSNPLPIAARLVKRGHEVDWYAGRVFHPAIAATGARPIAYTDAVDFGGQDIGTVFPQLVGSGPKIISRAFADVFIGQAPQRVADLRRILADRPADAMLSDGLMFGVGMLSELGGPPHATFGDGPLGYPEADTPPFGPGLLPMRGPVGRLRNRLMSLIARRVIFKEPQRVHDRIRADLGLPAGGFAMDAVFSPYLHLQVSTPSFEYPRRQLPPTVHWIGALRPDPVPGWTPPGWWGEVTAASRPVVLVSQGSLRPDLTELVAPALHALAAEDVLVVVTTGAAAEADVATAFGGPLPANVRVTRFVPYDELMPHVSVFVTNGGWSGLTIALHHGVPIVQAGTTEEKAENGARVQWSGVGLRLGSTRPAARKVGTAVRRVLTEPAFRDRAGVVSAELRQHDGPAEAADLLERLATTGKAVNLRAPARSV